MTKNSILFIVAIVCSISLHAQQESSNYTNAVGIRLGSNIPNIKSGFTFKHFINDNNALEAILSVGGGDGVGVCGLYEIHKPITAVANLQYFYGGGGYVGFANSSTNVGAAGIVGLDYKFSQLPLNISLDWKPELNIIPKIKFEGDGVGVSARFTF